MVLAVASLGVFLLFSAYVNLNDPDAALWSTAYATAAAACAASAATTAGRSPWFRRVCGLYSAASVVLAAYSFALLRKTGLQLSGTSGVFGIFELEPIREGGGATIMALAMALCATSPDASGKQAPAAAAAKGSRSSAFLTLAAVGVAVAGVTLGIVLPSYYNQLGVAIPEHCGGTGA